MNNVTITLSIEQVNIILAGLAKLPLEASIDTFTAVRQQADAQLNQSSQVTVEE